MGNLRPVLIIGLEFLGYMIWVQWQRDYGPAPQAAATNETGGWTSFYQGDNACQGGTNSQEVRSLVCGDGEP